VSVKVVYDPEWLWCGGATEAEVGNFIDPAYAATEDICYRKMKTSQHPTSAGSSYTMLKLNPSAVSYSE